ncbi:hypothetical protein K470DRAFT_263575 [Piedraia hortae CBS 480.64]|uniref:Uncharacterized protein n=1 Tax=Piedraia hortae CBS 480.64 TaxID=1314780 RepID=A0A6A7C1P1_9PEZI|nr:hypothetical protein K470DRAFT_263575 [Piedraia hortae CBS 480.64]
MSNVKKGMLIRYSRLAQKRKNSQGGCRYEQFQASKTYPGDIARQSLWLLIRSAALVEAEDVDRLREVNNLISREEYAVFSFVWCTKALGYAAIGSFDLFGSIKRRFVDHCPELFAFEAARESKCRQPTCPSHKATQSKRMMALTITGSSLERVDQSAINSIFGEGSEACSVQIEESGTCPRERVAYKPVESLKDDDELLMAALDDEDGSVAPKSCGKQVAVCSGVRDGEA